MSTERHRHDHQRDHAAFGLWKRTELARDALNEQP